MTDDGGRMAEDPSTGSGQAEEPVGIECTKCGCRHFYVIETRKAPKGVIVRRRECRHCGRRITTREKPD